MALATYATTALSTAGAYPRAGASQSSSRLPACDAHQRGALVNAPLSRGHMAHDQSKSGFRVVSHSLLTTSCELAGLRARSLSHSRSDARSSRCCVRKRVCLVPPGHTRAHSLRLNGSRRFRANILPRKPIHKFWGHAVFHVSRRLSSSLLSSGIDPNEIGLTHAQASFAPGAKTND